MSSGVMHDIEVGEYLVVLSDYGIVKVLAADGNVLQSQQLQAGSLVRLYDGMTTRWSIEETLRKVYFNPKQQ